MNNVVINYSTSGLGTPATGEDFISGLIFYGAPSATTFQAFSTTDAVNAGWVTHNITAATYSDIVNYHVNEFFIANPTGQLFVQTVTSGSSLTYSEIQSLQLSSGGILRQIGIYEQISFSAISLAAIQTQVTDNIVNNMPHEVIYQCDFSGVSNLTSLVDLSTLTYPNVSVCLGQDGANLGAALFTELGHSIGMVGVCLGAVSSADVEESIAWVANFNVSNVEYATPAFANGTLYSTLSPNLISGIDAKQYLFLRTFVGISGTYFNNDYTANVPTSDYSTIHLNRTIHKAARVTRAALLPAVASNVYFNTNGTIAINSVVYFKSLAAGALAVMQTNGEISQYQVIINTAQNVLATKILTMTLQIIPVGVADTISVNLGFVLSL